MYEPKSAPEAARLALLTERAQAILDEGYTFWPDPELGVAVCKPNELHASYWIADGVCDCPARQKDRTCKHEIAWSIRQAEDAQIADVEAEADARRYADTFHRSEERR